VLYPRLFGVTWAEIDTALQRMHCNIERFTPQEYFA